MPATIDLKCPSCGATNRVAREKTDGGAVIICGRCKTQIAGPPAAPLTVTDTTFAELIERSPLPVLVDLWAPWCGPCRMVSPIIDELARELAGRVRFAKLNVDENPRTAAALHVQGIPALVIYRNGREVDRLVGAHPKPAILQRLNAIIA